MNQAVLAYLFVTKNDVAYSIMDSQTTRNISCEEGFVSFTSVINVTWTPNFTTNSSIQCCSLFPQACSKKLAINFLPGEVYMFIL